MRKQYCSFLMVIVFICVNILNASGQHVNDSLLLSILSANNNPVLQHVIRNRDSFRVQIMYTRIDRDKRNRPAFHDYFFNVDSNLYFNPASTVKLPLALLALEKLNGMKKKGVNKYTGMLIDSNYAWQSPANYDNTSENGLPSIAHYIKKAFLVSDNDAYNRLYQFIGPQSINSSLHARGYTSTRITRQFLGLTLEQNRYTNAIRFVDKEGVLLYRQPPAFNPDSFYFEKIAKIGRGYLNSRDSLVNEPIDFTRVNNLPLEELHRMLQSVMFPESLSRKKQFRLSRDDYRFLHQYLSQFPSETNYPRYDSSQYYDSYVKFFFRDESHKMPDEVRVFNKVGWAYGFLIDVSYVVDFKNSIEYMLSAVVYVNRDGILNDNKYEYEEVGWPFMYQLGQTIHKYELKRSRKFMPDLHKFRIGYEKRDKEDNRPVVKDIDN